MATREVARAPAVEDYCKAIFTLEARVEEPVATNQLAERLGLTPGSVSAMLKRLGEVGVIEHHPYRGVRLTADGRNVALEVIRHHRLLELFLAESLQMPWDRVHAEAEVLEHVISEDLEQLREGDSGLFVRVSDSDPEMLRYLSERGIAPGDRLHVRERQPFGGPLLVAFGDGEDRHEHAIGGRLADAMRVQLDREPARPGSAPRPRTAPPPGSAA